MKRSPLDATSIPLTGTQVIEASAGTGKTYTITSLVTRLVTEGRLGIEEVLAVTFTNAASAELEGRIRQRLTGVRAALGAGDAAGDEVAAHLLALPSREEIEHRLTQAVQNVDRAAVTTIHGFCARALAEYALSSGARPDTTLLADDRGVLYDVVTDFWSRHVATLEAARFRDLRGPTLHADLAKVGRGVVNAPGVPLDAPPELEEGEGALTAYADHFPRAREAFFEHGQALRDLLRNDRSLNRNKYRVSTIEREFDALATYFYAGELDARSYPDRDEGRFTAERVRSAVKDKGLVLTHPLLDVLTKHRELCQQVVSLADRQRNVLLYRLATEIEGRLEQEHARLRTQSFDGLLRALDQGLEREGLGAKLAASIRRRYPALLIDEFQDTDPIQYRVFRRIYPPTGATAADGCGLFFIGDPKQSIYRFRGADVSTYLTATGGRDAPPVWTLGTNYRAGPRLVAAQNALFGLHARPFAATAIHYEPVRPKPGRKDLLLTADGLPAPGLRIVQTDDVDDMRLVAAEVLRLLTSGLLLGGRPVSPGDVAVLTRTNAQAEAVQAALRALRVPAVMHGDRSVFEAEEARELRRVLRAWLEPGQRSLVHAALATRLVGRTASELERLGSDADAFEREMERLRRCATAWRHRGIAVALETLFAEEGLLPRTLADIDGERRMTNFRHLLELLHQAEVERHLGMVGLLRFLELAIFAPTGHEMAAEARQVRLESDDDAVTLTTVHKSKGLEYGIVLLPQIGRPERKSSRSAPLARYHDPKRGGLEVLHIGDVDDVPQALALQEDREEALRLGYVGLTRAKHQVIAFMGEDKGFSALSWFLHGDALGTDLTDGDGWKALTDELIARHYAQLLEGAQGAVVVERASSASPSTAFAGSAMPSAVELVPPIVVGAPLTLQRTSSFSAMTRAKAPLSRAEREGKDVDRALAGSAPLSASPAVGGEVIALNEFPRGAGPGDALHAILERMPLAEGTPEARLNVLRSELARRGFDPVHESALDRCLSAALEVPLSPSGVRLLDLGPEDCARELEFSLPVRRGGPGADLLSPMALERALASFAEPSFLGREYAKRVGQLDFAAFEGFLRGFLDLVVFKQGQIFVVDYKSNHLGSCYADYAREHLQTAMESHHYLLQGLLYAVATHRYAKARIENYRYDLHFGGVSYLFLRGVDPAAPGAGSGVYFFRPSVELIEGLSRLLAGEAAA